MKFKPLSKNIVSILILRYRNFNSKRRRRAPPPNGGVPPQAGKCAVILTALSLLLISIWFKGGRGIIYGEMGLKPVYPTRVFNMLKFTWLSHELGVLGSTNPQAIPLYFLFSQLEKLGLSWVSIQAISFVFFTLVGSLSIYFLVLQLLSNRSRYSIALTGALFYILNPYQMIVVWHRFLFGQITMMALLPLAFLFYVRGLEKQRLFYAFFVGIASALLAYSFEAPGHIIALWLVLFSYLIFFLWLHRKERGLILYASWFTLLTIAAWVLLNLYWILPLYKLGPYGLSTSRFLSSEFSIGVIKRVSQYFRLQYILRGGMNAHYIFTEKTWGPIYSSPSFQAMGWLIPLVVLFGIVANWKNRRVRYFTALSLLGLFLAKGTSWPLGGWYIWLLRRFPFLVVLRTPLQSLGGIIPLGYAFLFGLGLYSIYERLKGNIATKNFKPLVKRMIPYVTMGLICVLTLVVYVWPMWTTKLFSYPDYSSGSRTYFRSGRIEIPGYYERVNEYLSEQEGDFRLLCLPALSPSGGAYYNWPYGYAGVEPQRHIFSRPVIARNIDNNLIRFDINKLIVQGPIWKLMALLNTRYIIINRDIHLFSCGEEQDIAKEAIKTVQKARFSPIDSMHYVKTFGQLDLYEIDENYLVNHIYATNQFILLPDEKTLWPTIQKTSFIPGQKIIFLKSQTPINDARLLSKLRAPTPYYPKILFHRINPVKYRVTVIEAEHPFFLVFNENYHPGWKATVAGQEIPHHFIANGYANTWYLDKKGIYWVELEFYPQRSFDKGWKISLAVIPFILGFLIAQTYKKRKR